MALANAIGTYRVTTVLAPPGDTDIPYPSDDGEPMAETEQQYNAITDAVFALQLLLKRLDRAGTVRGDCALYYDPRNPTAYITPDVLFVYDVQVPGMQGYAPWVHRKVPDMVMEIAAPSTYRDDSGSKWVQYADLGIPEYWQYDPHQKYLDPYLQGWRLAAGIYEPIPLQEDPGRGALVGKSEVLATDWGMDLITGALRLWDRTADHWFLTGHEADAAHQQAMERRVQAEATLQQAMERRVQAEATLQQAMERRVQAEATLQQAIERRVQAEQRVTETNFQWAAERLASLRLILALSKLPRDLMDQLDRHITAIGSHLPAITLDTIPDGLALWEAIRQHGGPTAVSYEALRALLPDVPQADGESRTSAGNTC